MVIITKKVKTHKFYKLFLQKKNPKLINFYNKVIIGNRFLQWFLNINFTFRLITNYATYKIFELLLITNEIIGNFKNLILQNIEDNNIKQ